MRVLAKAGLRFRSLFHRNAVERELEDELRFHLDQLVEENIAAGMPPNDARMSALQQIGGVARFQEECRDMRRVNFIDDFLRDLAYTARNLRRSPGFAALAILIMALGIGANTAIFSIVDSVVLRPLTYREPERLFVIHEIAPKFRNFAPLFPVNALHFREWQKRVPAFENMALLAGTDTNVTGPGEPQRITAAAVSPALFPCVPSMFDSSGV